MSLGLSAGSRLTALPPCSSLRIADKCCKPLHDPSAETDPIKTSASFTEAGVDANGKPRWFDETTGDLMQYTYDEEGDITGSEVVS